MSIKLLLDDEEFI